MIAHQMAAPNSPQWFNTGLHWAYGIDGPGQGHYYVDFRTGKLTSSDSAYEHPQPHACFIQSVNDDLVNENGIMDLWVREARLFKYGSGTGSNFSDIRGENEPLSGGGRSSGLMSFLKIGDRAAGAIKSGGTTRRAAKMVCLDVDHPDVESFIGWKAIEEQKVAALVTGSKICNQHLNAVAAACHAAEGDDEARFDPKRNLALKKAVIAARKAMVSENYIQRVIQFARQGYTEIDFRTYDTDWDSEAYLTVSGQNSNNSLRITNEFIAAVEADADWNLTNRTDGSIAKTVKARASFSASKEPPFQPQYAHVPAMRSNTFVARVSLPKRSSAGNCASAFSSGARRKSQAGTPFSLIRRSRFGTPALRKYFWASTSQATWLQPSGTSMSSSRNTIDPSGLRISLFVRRNLRSAYGDLSSFVKRRLMRIKSDLPTEPFVPATHRQPPPCSETGSR
jgi:hypothetical protein